MLFSSITPYFHTSLLLLLRALVISNTIFDWLYGAWALCICDSTPIFLSKFFLLAMILTRCKLYVGWAAVVAKLWVSCACSTWYFRVKEDDYTKENNVNTAKEGFELKALSPFTETLPEVQPLLLDASSRMLPAIACVMHAQRKLKVTGNTWDATAAS